MDKPTQGSVDALYAKGLSIKQIADLYGCSRSYIAAVKGKHSHGIWYGDRVTMDPVKPIEIKAARQVKAGHMVKVLNLHKMREGEGIQWGVYEWAGVVRKYPYIAVLDNGMSVDYAEIALQMRAAREEAGEQ